MRLNKILTILLFLSATLAHAGSKAPPLTPASAQESPPKAPESIPAAPVAPNSAVPGQEPQSPSSPINPAPLPLPSSHEMTTSYEGAFVRMLVTLLGLIFLVFATFWVLRRMGKGKFKMGTGRMINVIERRALSPKTMLYIVDIGNKKVLISESQLEVRALSSYEELPETSE